MKIIEILSRISRKLGENLRKVLETSNYDTHKKTSGGYLINFR